MDIFQSVKTWFVSGKVEIPDGYCPNCWGFQEYSGNFYEAVKNHGISVNNLDENRGWIQDYADKYLITIDNSHSDTEEVVCTACKIKYKLTK